MATSMMATTRMLSAMEMNQALSNFFTLHVHDTDSKTVHCEFSHKITIHFNWSNIMENVDNTQSIIFHLVYIARLHGLPFDFFPNLAHALKTIDCSKFSLKFKLQIATILKYCVTLNDEFRFPFSDLRDLILSLQPDLGKIIVPQQQSSQHSSNEEVEVTKISPPSSPSCRDNGRDEEIEQKILSQMMLTMAQLVSRENYGKFVESKLILCLSHITDPLVRSDVYKSIDSCRRLALTHHRHHHDDSRSFEGLDGQDDDDDELFPELLIDLQNSGGKTNDFSTRHKTNRGHHHHPPPVSVSVTRRSDDVFNMAAAQKLKGRSSGVKVDFVKVQQTSVAATTYKHSGSERVNLESINLTTALGNYRSKQSSSTATTAAGAARNEYKFKFDPLRQSVGGSDRGFLRMTTGNIDFFFEKVKTGSVIREQDVIWLKDCIINDSLFRKSMNFLVSLFPQYRSKVGEIFRFMAKRQVVPTEILEEMGHHLFGNILDPTWDDCRIQMLQAFYGFSSRNCVGGESGGQTLTALKNILTTFRSNGLAWGSTPEMDKWIWRIIQEKDENLVEAFKEAVDVLNQDKIPPDHIPYDCTIYDEFIAYVDRQVSSAPRCRQLEEMETEEAGTKFFHKFVKIVPKYENASTYGPRTRVQIVEIVEKVLTHDLPSSLNIFLDADDISQFIKAHADTLSIENDHRQRVQRNHNDESTTEEVWTWDDLDRQIYQKSVISCIILSLGKAEGLKKLMLSSKAVEKVLTFLITMCIRERPQEKELEALIVNCLGGILRREKNIRIPSIYSLDYKLLRNDFVDPQGRLHLQNQEEEEPAANFQHPPHNEATCKKKEGEEEEEDKEVGDVTFISLIVAQMFLSTFKRFEDNPTTATCPPETVLESIAQAAASSPDKMTKIVSTDCLYILTKFVSNLNHFGNDNVLSSLRQATTDGVWDVQVKSKIVYVTVLEKLSLEPSRRHLVSSQHLEHLTQIYAHDPLLLQGQDYTNEANHPIVKIFHRQAGFKGIVFSADIFNLLATVLNSNLFDVEVEEVTEEGSNETTTAADDDEDTTTSRTRWSPIDLILDTIYDYLVKPDDDGLINKIGVPEFCVEAVENLFLSQSLHNTFRRCVRVLRLISGKLGQPLSQKVVEQLYHNLLHSGGDALSTKSTDSFLLLADINGVQELGTKFFDRLDMEFIALRIFSMVRNYLEAPHQQQKPKPRQKPKQKQERGSSFSPLLFVDPNKPEEKESTDELCKFAKKLFPADTPTTTQSSSPSIMNLVILQKSLGQLLDRIQRNVKEGQQLTPLHFKNLHACLHLNFDFTNKKNNKVHNLVFQCLTQAAQNGQRLSDDVITAAYNFTPAQGENSAIITGGGHPKKLYRHHGQERIKNWRIPLALALIQNNQLLPTTFVMEMAQKFQTLDATQVDKWGVANKEVLDMVTKFGQNNQLSFPTNVFVAQKFLQCLHQTVSGQSGQETMSSGSSVVELQVNLLSALLPSIEQVQVFYSMEKNLKEAMGTNENLKFVFLKAMNHKNVEILKLGLKSFLSLNWHIMNQFGQDGPKFDYEDLGTLLKFQTVENSESLLGSELKNKLQNFISQIHTSGQAHQTIINCYDKDDAIFLKGMDDLYQLGGSKDHLDDLQGRLQGILSKKTFSKLQLTALQHICRWVENHFIAGETLEKVALCFENHKNAPLVPELCQNILDQALQRQEVSTEVKECLLKYLKNDAELFLDQLLIIAKDVNLRESRELQFVLQMRQILLEPDELERNGKIFDYFRNSSNHDPQLPISSHCLDDKTFIDLLNNFSSSNHEQFERLACPQFAHFVAENFLQFGLHPTTDSADNDCLPKSVILVLQNAVINHGRQDKDFLTESIFFAYRQVISQFGQIYMEQPQHAISSLDCMIQIFEAFSSTNHEKDEAEEDMRVAIFLCILETISLLLQLGNVKIPHTILPILTKYFDSPIPFLRKKAFDGLRLVKKYLSPPTDDSLIMIMIMMTHLNEIMASLSPVVLSIFQTIYGKERGKVVMDEDPEFSLDVFGMVLSVNFYGDLNRLPKIERGQQKVAASSSWRRHFLFADAITNFGVTEDEKMELHLWFSKLAEKFEKNLLTSQSVQCQQEANDIIELLIHRFRQSCPSYADVIVTLKSAIELTPGQLQRVCQYSKSNWQRSIELRAVMAILEPKILSFDQNNLFQVCTRFVESVADWRDFARIFCKTLKDDIENVQEVEDLVTIFEVWKDNIGKIAVKLMSQPNQLTDPEPTISIKDVKITIQIQLLIDCLPEVVGGGASQLKKRNRAESHLRQILSHTHTHSPPSDGRITTGQLHEFLHLLQQSLWMAGENFKILESIFLHTISQLFHYKVSSQSFQDLMNKLKLQENGQKSMEEITLMVAGHVNDEIFRGDHGIRNTTAIMEELKIANGDKEDCGCDWDGIKGDLIRIKISDKVSQIYKIVKDGESPKIDTWDLQMVTKWAVAVREMEKVSSQTSEFYMEALMVAKRTLFLVAKFQLTDIQILACLVALQPDLIFGKGTKEDGGREEQRGLLQQVGTGSGKSTIVAIIAVIKSLQGFNVDVYTSNHILAERDAKEWRKFYEIFGIGCDHNGDKCSVYIRGPKYCYRQSIVYGECAQFQFDHLRDFYSDLGTLAGRSSGRAGSRMDYAIVDEVDSMFIDDSSKLARLSFTIPGTDCLQLIFHLVWERLSLIKSRLFSISHQIYYLDGKIEVTVHNGRSVVSYSFGDEGTKNILKISDVLDYILTHNDQFLDSVGIMRLPNLDEFVSNHLTQYLSTLVSEGETINLENGGAVPEKNQQMNQTASQQQQPQQKHQIMDPPPKKNLQENRAASKEEQKESKINLNSLKIPRHLKQFVLDQIPKWVKSALTSLMFQLNQHYIIEDGQIKPVDFQTTGVIQSSTNWNDGLHQFLQIKHSLKLTAETVTTNFLSNMAIFSKYKNNLVGFTGTLGSRAGRNFLSSEYHVDHFVMPETHYKKYFRLPNQLCADEDSWLYQIVQITLEEAAAKRRGVLIICESIGKAEKIETALMEQGGSQIKLKIYTKNLQHQEKEIERVRPGDVIVATNLAGRGTDIKTVDIEQWGGLHVILTFLPETSRVEEQAFGRTARLGQKGTAGLVIVHRQNQNDVEETEGKFESSWTQQLEEGRNALEKMNLEKFKQDELPLIRTKDALFARFCQTFSKMREKLKKPKSIIQTVTQLPAQVLKIPQKLASKNYTPTQLDFDKLVILQAIEERWAMFLRKVDDRKICVQDATKEYELFEGKISEDFEKETILENTGGEPNAFYFIQLGNYAYTQKGRGSGAEAAKYFQKAIDQDPNFAAPALVGKAFAVLKSGRKGKGNRKTEMDGSTQNYKDEAIKLLNQALTLLHEEMSLLNCQHWLVTKRDGGVESDLFGQISAKISILGSYINSIETVIETVRKSLRKIEYTGTHLNKSWEQGTVIDFLAMAKNFNNYTLHFHDLTAQHHDQSSDQALATIQKAMENEPVPKICFQCPGANLELLMLPTTETFFKTVKDVDIELFNLNVENVLWLFKNLENCPPSSISLEVAPTTDAGPILTSLAMMRRGEEGGKGKFFDVEIKRITSIDDNFPEFSSCHDVHQKVKPTVKVDHLPLLNEKERMGKLKSFDEFYQVSAINFINLNGGDAIRVCKKIEEILKKSSTNLLSSPIFTVSLFSLEKTASTLVFSWANVFQKFSQNHVTLHAKDIGWLPSVENILQILRNSDTPFILQFTNIPSHEKALSILKNAEIHQEDFHQSALKLLCDLYPADHMPMNELREYSARGIELLVTFNEKNFIPWQSVMTMGTVAALEAASGALLLMTGFGSTIGTNLLVESLSDVQMTYQTYSNRSKVDWSKYRWRKASNLLITATSLGLGRLAGKVNGARTLAQGASSVSSGIMAGPSISLGYLSLLSGVQATGTSVQSAILKQAAAFGVAQGSRVALKTFTSTLSNFTFERIRAVINAELLIRIEAQFENKRSELGTLLSRAYALDKCRGTNLLRMKIEKTLESTMSSSKSVSGGRSSTMWTQMWDTVGLKLCKEVFALPKYATSTFTLISGAARAIKNAREVEVIVGKVCTEICRQVDADSMSAIYVVNRLCKIEPDRAKELVSKIQFESPPIGGGSSVGFRLKKFPGESEFRDAAEYNLVKNCFQKLAEYQTEFGVKNVDVGQIIRMMADKMTSQIVQSGDTQLANPRNSFAVTRLHSNMAADNAMEGMGVEEAAARAAAEGGKNKKKNGLSNQCDPVQPTTLVTKVAEPTRRVSPGIFPEEKMNLIGPFFRKQLYYLCKNTKNLTEFALKLRTLGAIDQETYKTIMGFEQHDGVKLLFMYKQVLQNNLIDPLLVALTFSGNDHIVEYMITKVNDHHGR